MQNMGNLKINQKKKQTNININTNINTKTNSPTMVVIFTGTNDVGYEKAIQDDEKIFIQMMKSLSHVPPNYVPNADSYIKNLGQILDIVHDKVPNAKVLIVAPPPIGEELSGTRNKMLGAYLEKLRQFCMENQASKNTIYVPVYEKIAGAIQQHYGTSKAPPQFPSTFGQAFGTDWALVKKTVMLKNWNAISKSNGLFLTVDHIHLNETGADMVADFIQAVINQQKNPIVGESKKEEISANTTTTDTTTTTNTTTNTQT